MLPADPPDQSWLRVGANANLAGLPACTVPIGSGAGGLIMTNHRCAGKERQ